MVFILVFLEFACLFVFITVDFPCELRWVYVDIMFAVSAHFEFACWQAVSFVVAFTRYF